VELGVTFLDTADSYGPGLSEEVIARALHPYPSDLVIATKGGVVRLGRDQAVIKGHPSELRAACEASLRRLRLEAISLYQLHWRDPRVPLEEQIGALADLVAAGKVRHVGLCNVDVAELEEAQRITPIAAVQCGFGLADRRHDSLVRHCARQGIIFIAHGPLSVLQGNTAPRFALATVAQRLGATEAQVALSWILHHSPNTLAIPGTLRQEHLVENLGAARLALSERCRSELEP
jgi:aryl-alcohol dehydrogenase-like predicted oxidoreductase